MKKLTPSDVSSMCFPLLGSIQRYLDSSKVPLKQIPGGKKIVMAYAIPRGGVPVAYALLATSQRYPSEYEIVLTDKPEEADIFIDDVIDSATTATHYRVTYGKPTFALVNKSIDPEWRDIWVAFPWEQGENGDAEDNVRRLIQFVGDDARREGLLETPKRVVKAWKHWCSGYDADIGEILKVFEDGAENYDQMVTVKDIPFYSKCEHHMADIFGTVTISYIPNGKIVGLSKLSRLADAFARRLQVQERFTCQIADALMEHLEPKGVGVAVRARHMCMESRGICQQGHHTVTTALRGELLNNSDARAEFMALARQ